MSRSVPLPSTKEAPKQHAKTKSSLRKAIGKNFFNRIITGDAAKVLVRVPADSIDLSFWSPPYFVGKSYEKDLSFTGWQDLIRNVIAQHARILRAGSFLVINIADILCFADPQMPRYQADNLAGKKHKVTREQIQKVQKQHPDANRHELAAIIGCSEQTIQRRLENNNVRGGKHDCATKVFLTGGMVSKWAEEAGLYLYDRRVWRKDPCWVNSRWHSVSYRAVDEFEYLYVFWKPGQLVYDRNRLSANEWSDWGSRGVWEIPSVRQNRRHEAEFPELLAERVIRLFSPERGTVIDPFSGTGTTLTVAKRLDRNWLGIDVNPSYNVAAQNRIGNGRG